MSNVRPIRDAMPPRDDQTAAVVAELRALADAFERGENTLLLGTGAALCWQDHVTRFNTFSLGGQDRKQIIALFDHGHAMHMRDLYRE